MYNFFWLRKYKWVVLLGLPLLLTACGNLSSVTLSGKGGTATPQSIPTFSFNFPTPTPTLWLSTGDGIDPCKLLTQAQIDQEFHIQDTSDQVFEISPLTDQPLRSTCFYRLSESNLGISTSVGISADAQNFYQTSKAADHPTGQASGSEQDVDRVGDAAYSLTDTSAKSTTIVALKGNAIFGMNVQSQTVDPAMQMTAAQALMKDAEQVIDATLPTLTPPRLDPCTVLSQQEMSQGMQGHPIVSLGGISSGLEVDQDEETANPALYAALPVCRYLDPDNFAKTSADPLGFSAGLTINASGTNASSIFEQLHQPVNGPEDVSGIGDSAFFIKNELELVVLKGQVVFTLFAQGTNSSADGGSDIEGMKQLALVAVSHL